eukprot:TRINITY_DN47655_c0_g1_i1.p1 TRINITY_DN47655_c0_g1~~TRINITY_DN47655_c0_g1_i1.p1  ORF type:complete len:169 (+),score=31.16 TRINITY_DN47655_c0_g1_i1:58-564(+)
MSCPGLPSILASFQRLVADRVKELLMAVLGDAHTNARSVGEATLAAIAAIDDGNFAALLADSSLADPEIGHATLAAIAAAETFDPAAAAAFLSRTSRTLMHAQATRRAVEHVDTDCECGVCLDGTADACLVPCGHQNICVSCAERLNPRTCPICRTGIDGIIRTARRS